MEQVCEMPKLMGIVNVNDDSFCSDGTLNLDEAVEMAVRLIDEGADVIDVGAESARTNRKAISVSAEVSRFTGFMSRWQEVIRKARPRDDKQIWPPQLSLNTWRTEVIEQILPLGGDILNDMSGLPNADNAKLAALYHKKLLIMHSVGEPKVAHTEQQWDDVMSSMLDFFSEKIALAQSVGLEKENLILDPGIDFAKQSEHNLQVYSELKKLSPFNCELLIPVSRKTVIGDVLNISDPMERDAGTVACLVSSMLQGGTVFRVHNVAACYDTVRLIYAVEFDRGNIAEQEVKFIK